MAKPKTEGRTLRIPRDIYDDLQRLQGVYPGRTLGEIASILLRDGLKKEAKLLDQLRSLERKPPPAK